MWWLLTTNVMISIQQMFKDYCTTQGMITIQQMQWLLTTNVMITVQQM